jgi:NDP-sugar pyrophosphorylase family protein
VSGASQRLTLVILAAGLGTRFGGDKARHGMGPSGEILADYSVFDAWRAGFTRLVLVSAPGAARGFAEGPGRQWERRLDVEYVEQPPSGRRKPWGTAHAVLAAAGVVEGSFAVANGDDFYGAESWRRMAERLRTAPDDEGTLAGFRLRSTLPPRGQVSRALCRVEGDGRLSSLVEASVEMTDGGIVARTSTGTLRPTGDELVSMNLWGLPSRIRPALEDGFAAFLARLGGSASAEYLLPEAIGEQVREGRLAIQVLGVPGPWLGITHPADAVRVSKELARMAASGLYPSPLWS